MTLNYCSTKGKHQGNVLITTLILMTMTAILGLNAMESVILEQSMVTGYQNQNIAFNAAENALNKGEKFITALNNPMVSTPDERYHTWDFENADSFEPLYIANVNWAPYLASGDIEGAQEAFVVQYLGKRSISGEEWGRGQRQSIYGAQASFFRLGAYGAGPLSAKRVVDVVYATLQ